MAEYEFKAIGLIEEEFERRDVHFAINEDERRKEIRAGFPIDGGPKVIVRFISVDDDNDVAIRLYGIVSRIPDSKRPRMLEAANTLNKKLRFFDFSIDDDGDLNMEYDIPLETPDEAVGAVAFEMFVRAMHILDDNYPFLMKAMYGEEEHAEDDSAKHEEMELLRSLLAGLQDRASGETDDDGNGNDNADERNE